MSELHEPTMKTPDPKPEEPSYTPHGSVNWDERTGFPKRLIHSFATLSQKIEKPIRYWVRDEKFNPLYHTGTITLLLLLIILGTGIYLTMFYQFGFEASYQAVADIEANWVGRLMRALHRYASDAAVIFGLLHGWRTFFQDRFRGPRWLAWTTGVGMSAFVWLIGISGYWLIWDERAGVLNQTLIDLVNGTQTGTKFLLGYLVTGESGSGWIFMVLMITIHLGLSAVVGAFYWWHIKKLNRPKWLPPNYWIIAVVSILVLGSLLIPTGMLDPPDPSRFSQEIRIDIFYLFYLPGVLKLNPLIFWAVSILAIAFISILPWLLKGKTLAPITVTDSLCTGCTLCAEDCPYIAIQMVDRKDETRHKYLAVIDPTMCVSCGICIGTCTPLALSFGPNAAESLWEVSLSSNFTNNDRPKKIIYICERHALQGSAKEIREVFAQEDNDDSMVQVIPLTCVGMAHPDMASSVIEAGASEVHFIGCPPEDCINREGNLWLQKRLDRERLPKLNTKYKQANIRTTWVSPGDISKAIKNPDYSKDATGYNLDFSQIKWLRFFPAVSLLGIILGLQIWLSDLRYRPFPDGGALVEISMNHRAGHPLQGIENYLEPELGLVHPTHLILKVDGKTLLDKSYPPKGPKGISATFEQISVLPGKHSIQLTLFDRPQQTEGLVLLDQNTTLDPTEILRIDIKSQPPGSDASQGEKLFHDRSIGSGGSCSLCHSLEPDQILVGPSLFGIANQAGERVPGMNAEDYIRESIIDPDAYIVEGFPSGQMLPDLEQKLTLSQIDDLIAYLLTTSDVK